MSGYWLSSIKCLTCFFVLSFGDEVMEPRKQSNKI